jgi:hypothetical protein
MGKGLVSLLFGAVLAFSGCAYHKAEIKEAVKIEKKELNKKVDYNWNGYTINQKKLQDYTAEDLIFNFQRDYIKNEPIDKCSLSYKVKSYKVYGEKIKITLENEDCDKTVEWIKDNTGLHYVKNGPIKRFKEADNAFKDLKENLNVENVHKAWELNWTIFDHMLDY